MLIRNRKMLQAKRRRYSHVMQSFHAIAQEMAKQDAMIEWLARQLDEYGECSPPDAPCHDGEPYLCPSASPINEKRWLKEREKLREINGCYSYDFYLMQEEDSLLREGFWTTYQKYWSQFRKRITSVEANRC